VYVCKDMAETITESTFQAEVLESTQPVLVEFWAEWCGPCHAVSPILDQISQERQLRLVKVNIDEEQELARRYGVMSIPTMILFEGGEAKAAAIGAQPKGMLEKSLGFSEA
jgi:thioredoxin 1